jgi:hypothetical protein
MQNQIYKKLAIYLEGKTVPHPEYAPLKLQDLNEIEDYSIDDIYCNCLEYVTNPIGLLNDLTKKISGNGQLTVEAYEIFLIARNIAVGIINISDINNLLYMGKISCVNMIQISELLVDNGFEILDRDIDSMKFVIISKRNNA